MKQPILFFSAMIAVLLIVGCTENQNYNKAENPGNVENANPGNGSDSTIKISSEGFNPAVLAIKKGESVEFVNRDSQQHWPASEVHPTHTAYPGSGISKCGTGEKNKIFDACRGLRQGESFSFLFNEKGNWKYHDHFNPGRKGAIIVE